MEIGSTTRCRAPARQTGAARLRREPGFRRKRVGGCRRNGKPREAIIEAPAAADVGQEVNESASRIQKGLQF